MKTWIKSLKYFGVPLKYILKVYQQTNELLIFLSKIFIGHFLNSLLAVLLWNLLGLKKQLNVFKYKNIKKGNYKFCTKISTLFYCSFKYYNSCFYFLFYEAIKVNSSEFIKVKTWVLI